MFSIPTLDTILYYPIVIVTAIFTEQIQDYWKVMPFKFKRLI